MYKKFVIIDNHNNGKFVIIDNHNKLRLSQKSIILTYINKKYI